jgi:hypothetical protein
VQKIDEAFKIWDNGSMQAVMLLIVHLFMGVDYKKDY